MEDEQCGAGGVGVVVGIRMGMRMGMAWLRVESTSCLPEVSFLFA